MIKGFGKYRRGSALWAGGFALRTG